MAIIVNSDKCRGCGLCVKNCPFDAVSLNADRKPVFGVGCTECGKCIDACPFGAIEKKAAEKEKAKTPSGRLDKDDKGNRIIWPGYKDEFVFYVQNDGEVGLNYQISFAEDNKDKIPLRFKLLADDQYLLGSESEWVDSANYAGPNILIMPGETVEYKIVWEWEDKNTEESNKYDTQLGVEGLAEYIVHSTVYFEEVL